ncbi:MAG: hypothetical protein ACLFTE_11675 [Salinivenus sp.]
MNTPDVGSRWSPRTLPLLGVLFGVLFLGPLTAPSVQAQDWNQAPRVYIDCDRCDYNHIRREVTLVRYVREPQQADIHVFVTVDGTGGGGRQYEFSFLGRRDFEGVDYSLTRTVGRDATDDEAREEVNRVLEMGLSPYLLKTPLGETLSLEYPESQTEQEPQDATEDPWNYWVFEIYGGRVRMSYESNQSDFRSRWGFFADRVTDTWKTRLRPYFNFSYVRIEQEDGDPVTSRTHRHGFDSYAIRSLNQHWSVGLFADYITRNDRNLEHRVRLNPGIEYSLFPYQEATRRSVTLRYQVGLSMVDYYEETIFMKTSDRLANHELEASVSFEQPWGEVDAGVTGFHYFHDASRYRAQLFGRASIRIVEGLSLNFSGSIERIQDQLSLPRGDTSAEDVLLDQRELATDVSLTGSISLSYSFGSDFADVVNTRF